MANAKVCVWWQGRKAAPPADVKKYGVYTRCFQIAKGPGKLFPKSTLAMGDENIDAAVAFARALSRRRSGGAAVNWESSSGLSQTLLTCHRGKCKPTIYGKKLFER